jgi:hypothetical protein
MTPALNSLSQRIAKLSSSQQEDYLRNDFHALAAAGDGKTI